MTVHTIVPECVPDARPSGAPATAGLPSHEVTNVALNFAQKEAIVAEVAEVARGAHSAIGAEYRGLSVAEMTRLRVEARKSGVFVRVV